MVASPDSCANGGVNRPGPGAASAAYEYEVAVGSWRPFPMWALSQLAYDGDILPDQRVRDANNPGDIRTARELPGVPRGDMLRRHYARIGRFLEKCPYGDISVADMLRRDVCLRGWAAGGVKALSAANGSNEPPAGSTEAAWFLSHVDFGDAVVCEHAGLLGRAESIYERIASDQSRCNDRRLAFCASHQLACLRVVQGGKTAWRGFANSSS